MSFILDALRKSENERRRTALPGITQVPLVARRPGVPTWATAVIVLLGVTVLALGTAWWRSSREDASPTAREIPLELPPPSTADAQRDSALTTPSEGRDAVDEHAAPSLAAVTPPVEEAAAPIAEPGEPEPATAAKQSHSTPPSTATADQDAGSSDAPLPSAEALAAEGVSVPPLRLELHAYSDRPAERYVFINGSKYTEGARLAEGPRVVSIVPSGVVLSEQGRQFLLTPE